MKIFGPVPSRRLGNSLGINIIPAKVCSYSCIYCQIGSTNQKQITQEVFYDSQEIYEEVCRKLDKIKSQIDYLTFVADGEPTLDKELSHKIDLLRPLGFKIAVISNSSLMMNKQVRESLLNADLVSLKVDAFGEIAWKEINRPEKSLQHEQILQGILSFGKDFSNTLLSETMLVKGVNDSEEEVQGVADFLGKMNPDVAYLAVPIRPPALDWVKPSAENTLVRAYQQLSSQCRKVETLTGYEGNEFGTTGNVEEDLLSIMAVHPMRNDAITEFLERNNEDWSVIDKLIAQNLLTQLEYQENTFYLRKFSL